MDGFITITTDITKELTVKYKLERVYACIYYSDNTIPESSLCLFNFMHLCDFFNPDMHFIIKEQF